VEQHDKSISRSIERIRQHRALAADIQQLSNHIVAGDRTALALGITLLESGREDDMDRARQLVQLCLPRTGNSIRLGITGVPGVGKSTFIERAGMHILEQGHRLAVLAIDPSSTRSGGSILGDKTRMERLSADARAFIRPSPSRGSLGGVAHATRESMLLCEAAGYNVIIIETVGVGQSETAVFDMVDHFLLLMLAGAGDELQGIKRGIMEMAHSMAITKCDGGNELPAEQARVAYRNALHLMPALVKDWEVPVHTTSALTGKGIDAVWDDVLRFDTLIRQNGTRDQVRGQQNVRWLYQALNDVMLHALNQRPDIHGMLQQAEAQVRSGQLSPLTAARNVAQQVLGR
jgi:LAO/AO transport system kinase